MKRRPAAPPSQRARSEKPGAWPSSARHAPRISPLTAQRLTTVLPTTEMIVAMAAPAPKESPEAALAIAWNSMDSTPASSVNSTKGEGERPNAFHPSSTARITCSLLLPLESLIAVPPVAWSGRNVATGTVFFSVSVAFRGRPR